MWGAQFEMPKRARGLTAVSVRSLKAPGRYGDGNGLYLVVDPSGARRWLLRIVIRGRRRDLGLGSAALVSLAEAREQALMFCKVARAGGDPLELRIKQRQSLTFEQAARQVHEAHRSSWRNEKHAAQWLSTLETYAFPIIGDRSIEQVGTPDLLKVLSPIWLAKPETARRVRQRLGTVMDWAAAAGHRTGDNPIGGVSKGLPKQERSQGHHAAMPFTDVPAFVMRLRGEEASDVVKLALEFLILTAARTGEVIGAKWSEIDLEETLWTVPSERMKAKRTHRVPLSGRAVEILRSLKRRADGEYVFPGRADQPLSNMAFNMLLRRMRVAVTTHGFRSSFRDWAAETTAYPREVAEMALAHTIENKVESAYRRGDLLDKRKVMMDDWTAFLANGHRPDAPPLHNPSTRK